MTIFYSDMEPLSKYSPVTIHLSPATRILSENPLMVSVLHKELEGKVGKLKCKTLEVMKNEKQIWNSITWINHTRPVYMKYCSHDTVYHLLMNNNKGGGEGGWKERGSLEKGAFKLKKKHSKRQESHWRFLGQTSLLTLPWWWWRGSWRRWGWGWGWWSMSSRHLGRVWSRTTWRGWGWRTTRLMMRRHTFKWTDEKIVNHITNPSFRKEQYYI